MTAHDMTFTALSRRADSVMKDDAVADIIGGDDYRAVNVFLEHEIHSDMRGDDTIYTTTDKRIIGVALADLDDPLADIEILNRDGALELFGRAWVEQCEAIE